MIGRKIMPNRYVSATSLTEIGLLDEINFYINRMGWNDFIMMQNPSYTSPTYEFLSSFNFNDCTLMTHFSFGE